MDASLWCTMIALHVCYLQICTSFLIPSWPVAHAAPNRREQAVRDVHSNAEEQLRQLLFKDRKREYSRLAERDVSKRIVDARVSFKECNLDPGLRLDCGFFGMSEHDCYERGCCWGETTTEGVPWCYHSIPTLSPECSMEGEERLNCGWYGMRKEQCLASDCCWRPSNDQGQAWCFHTKRTPAFEGECGVPSISPMVSGGRIVGGEEVKPHSWPWMVSLQSGSHFCGGSLINDQWVMTAAHCEPGFGWGSGGRQVVIGMHNQGSEEPMQVTVEVAEVIPHEDYDGNIYDKDVMLLKLVDKVDFGESVQPVCLPEQGSRVEVGTHCYATGWGDTTFMGSSPDKLQQVMVPILSVDTCNQDNFYGGKITDNMICAGYHEGGRDSCQGDSGGPLVCYTDEHWVLYGVVSWGEGCAGEEKPGLYARVSNFVEWAENVIQQNS